MDRGVRQQSGPVIAEDHDLIYIRNHGFDAYTNRQVQASSINHEPASLSAISTTIGS